MEKKALKALVLYASPNEKGTSYEAGNFVCSVLKKNGIQIRTVHIARSRISPCLGKRACRERAFCIQKDDMQKYYKEIKRSDIIFLVTPIYFYSVPSQMKAFIDRCQVFWEEKYYKDPNVREKTGFLIVCGEMRRKDMFDCVEKVVRIFYRTIKTAFAGKYYFSGDFNKKSSVILEKRVNKLLLKIS